MPQEALDMLQPSASLAFEPAPVQVLGGAAELNENLVGSRFSLAPRAAYYENCVILEIVRVFILA
jgi:hypothetical protein